MSGLSMDGFGLGSFFNQINRGGGAGGKFLL